MNENMKNHQNEGKNNQIIRIISIALAILIAFVGGFFVRELFESRNNKVARDIISVIEKAGYIIDSQTGEERTLTEEDIADAITNTILDQYSAYYTKEEYEQISESGKGNQKGLGISFYTNTPIVTMLTGNSPAEKAGIMRGDKIICAKEKDGQTINFSTSMEVISFVSNCEEQSEIIFTIERKGTLKEFSMKKIAYIASYVTYYDSESKFYFASDTPEGELKDKREDCSLMEKLPEDTALIRLNLFEGDASSQMSKALDYMAERGRSKLILDLTDNGGGFIDTLCEIAPMLIYNNGNNDFIVAYAQKNSGVSKFFSKNYDFKEHIKKIAVVANENTASASECLIGALAYYGGAFSLDNLVVEENGYGEHRTYGKGIMQTTYKLLSGGWLKLTTAKITWPDKSTCIHGRGIKPNSQNAVEKWGGTNRAIEILAD